MSRTRTREVAVPTDYSLRNTLRILQMGRYDPSLALTSNALALAVQTPQGSATLEAEQVGANVHARIWGEGGEWLEERLPALLGLRDKPHLFTPRAHVLRELQQRFPGVHLPRLPLITTRIMQVVLLQLVSWKDGLHAYTNLTKALGEPAPGPHPDLILPPTAQRIARTPVHELCAHGMLERQAKTLHALAHRHTRIERAASEGHIAFAKTLLTVPGVGPWTIEYSMGSALGVADAVLIGDYHLPHCIAWTFAGEPRADDTRMLELLEPYAGHRFRVIRLLWLGGKTAPRRAPKRSFNRRC